MSFKIYSIVKRVYARLLKFAVVLQNDAFKTSEVDAWLKTSEVEHWFETLEVECLLTL